MTLLKTLSEKINNSTELDFKTELLGESVLKITSPNMEDFPILMSVSGQALICQTSVIAVSEIPSGKSAEFNSAILQANPQMPLSNVAIDGDSYVIFGELSADSKFESILTEIEILRLNTIEFMESVQDFLA
jgi:uncharacterized protein YjfI (DUF2170 family)